MSGEFTKRKFLGLPVAQRHKKCAEMLCSIYKSLLDGTDVNHAIEAYNQLSQWLEIPPLVDDDHTIQIIADRYHTHTALANQHHKEHNLLPNIRQGDRPTASPPWTIALYLDNIRSAHNVGSMLRTVEAFSFGSVHFSAATPYIDNKQVKDASMGTSEWITCHRNSQLKDLPRPIFAMETSPDAQNIFLFEFPETFTLAVGNEEYGCSESTLTIADALIEIPLRGRKNSLNVANAFAIAAAEISRQKGDSIITSKSVFITGRP